MEESGFKKFTYNCKKATFLIEKKQIANISMHEKLELRIHLAGCSDCRIFGQQSLVINKLVHDLFHNQQATKGTKLDNDLKRKCRIKLWKA